ncbi:MAG: hypothetical protein H6Q72_1910 [Firmicutes bacterium]|nr:hypothetical protein [Bacillota bacterium]
MIEHFFVFPNCVNIEGQLTIDITPGQYKIECGENQYTVNRQDIPDNSSFCLLYDYMLDDFIPIEHWEKLTACLNMRSMETLAYLQQSCVFQIHYYNKIPFVKVFLPQGQQTLVSHTHNFSENSYFPISFIHPLDYLYFPTFDIFNVSLDDAQENVIIDLHLVPSVTNFAVYANYGMYCLPLNPGVNHVTIPYCPGESLYIGAKGEKKKVTLYDLEEALCIHN